MPKGKNITIDHLAVMVQKGFGETHNDLVKFRNEVNQRFDRIEAIILEDHRERINRLEDQVKELQTDFRSLVGKK